MKKTRERIIDTALLLFNTLGLSQVTLRTIAKEMGISQGNLNYHYKKRGDIIEKLYFMLVEEIDTNISDATRTSDGLQLLFNISNATMHTLYKYRFFLLDFTQITRENNKIRTHYQSLVKIREEQITGVFSAFVAFGLMREERLKDEYLHLYKRIQILGDFWLPSAKIEKEKITKSIISEYSEIINRAIFPYLTDEGIKQYNALI